MPVRINNGSLRDGRSLVQVSGQRQQSLRQDKLGWGILLDALVAQQDYEVTETPISTGGVQVSVRRGGAFKAIIGLKTALNVRIEPVANGTKVEAGVGIFGQQAIPTAITLLVFWPVIIAQVWNMAQEAKLDEEALRVAEQSLKAHSEVPGGATAEQVPAE